MSEILLIPRPTKKFPKLSDDQRQAISDQISRRSDTGLEWLEKIRRFSSVSGRNLRSVAVRKYGADCDVLLRWRPSIRPRLMRRFIVSMPLERGAQAVFRIPWQRWRSGFARQRPCLSN